jgi:acetyltransferase-like isoleucine patch superfamily enzyme
MSLKAPEETPEEINLREIMTFYKYEGKIGKLKLYYRVAKSWFLQLLASFSPYSGLTVLLHRMNGVRIGKHVYIGPYVQIEGLYPELITIEDYVSIGMNSMIFAHSNPTNSIWLKTHVYPRRTARVTIKRGAWIAPGNTILAGVTIGENSVVGACSLVINDVKPYTVVAGLPAKQVKGLEEFQDMMLQKNSD